MRRACSSDPDKNLCPFLSVVRVRKSQQKELGFWWWRSCVCVLSSAFYVLAVVERIFFPTRISRAVYSELVFAFFPPKYHQEGWMEIWVLLTGVPAERAPTDRSYLRFLFT